LDFSAIAGQPLPQQRANSTVTSWLTVPGGVVPLGQLGLFGIGGPCTTAGSDAVDRRQSSPAADAGNGDVLAFVGAVCWWSLSVGHMPLM